MQRALLPMTLIDPDNLATGQSIHSLSRKAQLSAWLPDRLTWPPSDARDSQSAAPLAINLISLIFNATPLFRSQAGKLLHTDLLLSMTFAPQSFNYLQSANTCLSQRLHVAFARALPVSITPPPNQKTTHLTADPSQTRLVRATANQQTAQT